MEIAFRDDFDSSVRVLLDGFGHLKSEYILLSEKHHDLQQEHSLLAGKLAHSKPDSPQTSFEGQLVLSSDQEPPRRLHEWLEQVQGHDRKSADVIPAIKKAELACSKLKSLLHRAQITKSYRSDIMEQDFTTVGNAGKLGCPFTPPRRRKPAIHIASADPQNAPPTPQSSSSHLNSYENGVKRPSLPKRNSYNDPIAIEQCAYDTPTVTGTACPIRFLGQHSPEEIAKYFENHKHEIPRSHEVCVKRFQDNAQSIKQLDAKYGNLVNMLQGLGMKHQPMLPEQADENVMHDEERQSNQKVANWARSVNENTSNNALAAHEPRETSHEIPSSPHPDEEEERVAHFDRPLKEIRVGESPSRPWGISIPPQYIEKARSNTSDRSVPRAPADVPEQTHMDSKLHGSRGDQEATKGDGKPAGKCPFPFAQKAAPEARQLQPEADGDIDGIVQTSRGLPRAEPGNPHAVNPPAISTAEQLASKPQTGATFTNHGIAVIHSARFFKQNTNFINYGTVFVDSPTAALELLRANSGDPH